MEITHHITVRQEQRFKFRITGIDVELNPE